MADEPDNLVLRLLQDVRADVQAVKSKVDSLDEHFAELKRSVDGNTIVFNLVAGATLDHEERIRKLEAR